MANFTIWVASLHDVPAIVNLANQYTYQNLSTSDRESSFLTGVFSETAVGAMISSAPSIVAYYQNHLAGFVLNTRLAPAEYPPLVQRIIKTLPDLTFRNLPVDTYPYCFYGPVLVAQQYRSQGLLRHLFLKATEALKSRFNLALAFIDEGNGTSYQVHVQHLGFTQVGKLTFNNRSYAIVAFWLG
ncbi:GNAT family N-acetyltransferase [Adhaeribacter pallidiroseus]|uniref:N-acetyltransferase domain-containing protein n=1 Tax=Adhaeribacter pallidiroseus TaxID=2072847 RepID=A0A369QSA8_9BACT|nr:hypothetical protein [Adhaeribacter pallidiroseus]RDC66535.1 hypothetical protein AHMF7616_05166 [Adhaeribacter pallidiroseus]